MKRFLLLPLLLILTTCNPLYAGGEYENSTTTISGTVEAYIRSPYQETINTYGLYPSETVTLETIKLIPGGDVTTKTIGRVQLSAEEFMGKNIPLYSPADGSFLGYFDFNTYFTIKYSMMVLANNKRKGTIRYKDPATICYVTNAAIVECP